MGKDIKKFIKWESQNFLDGFQKDILW